MISGLFDFRASACTNSPPMPSAAAPASMNSAAVFRLTPPVGTSGICGSGPFRALMYFAPPTWPHGKILTKSAPASQAVMTSIGVHLFTGTSASASNARSDSLHHLHDFLEGCHGSVSRRGHGERPVRGATFHRPLRILSRQEPVNQPGSKGIAPSDAVENFKVFAAS